MDPTATQMSDQEIDHLAERKKIEYILANYKPSKKYQPKPRNTAVEDELDELLNTERIGAVSRKKVEALVQKYVQEKRPELSLEGKATLEMVPQDRDVLPTSKDSLELIDRDLAKMDYIKLHETSAPVFKSEAGNEALSLKEKSLVEAKRLSETFGLPLAQSRDMMKEFVFLKKKEEEINAAVREKRDKKERMQKLLESLKEIRKNEFRIKEAEYEHIRNVINKRVDKDFFGILKVTQTNDSKQSKPIERKFQIYRVQTEERMLDYLREHFYSTNDHLHATLRGITICVFKVLLNDGLSVLDVFWEQDASFVREGQLRADFDPDELSLRLEKYAKRRLHFNMMRDMGLKKPVELRFYYSLAVSVEQNIAESFKADIIEMAKDRIVEECSQKNIDPNSVTAEEFQKAIDRMQNKLMFQFDEKLDYKSLRRRYHEHSDEQEAAGGSKRLRNNRNEDGSRKKTPKKDRKQAFWSSLRE